MLTPGIDYTIGVDDAYIEYVADGWSLLIGEHKAAAPLGERISSLDTVCRGGPALVNAFGFRQRAGLAFLTGGESWSLRRGAGRLDERREGEGDVDERARFRRVSPSRPSLIWTGATFCTWARMRVIAPE